MAGTPSDNPEEAHTDLMALIKASRELNPDMDKALAESFMEKHKLANQGGSQQAVVAQTGQQTPEAVNSIAGAVISMVGIAAYIVALIVSQGHLWWIIFPLMAFGFGGWRGYGHSHDEHRRMHDERHLAREHWRRGDQVGRGRTTTHVAGALVGVEE